MNLQLWVKFLHLTFLLNLEKWSNLRYYNCDHFFFCLHRSDERSKNILLFWMPHYGSNSHTWYFFWILRNEEANSGITTMMIFLYIRRFDTLGENILPLNSSLWVKFLHLTFLLNLKTWRKRLWYYDYDDLFCIHTSDTRDKNSLPIWIPHYGSNS